MATVGLSRRSFLACCTALGAASLNTRRVFAQNDQMRTTVNQWPWTGTRDAVACNYALGHLGHNLRQRLTIEGRIHAETYISAVGAIAGYAAQRTLFAETPPVVGVNINRVAVASGEQYWFGDTLNYMLVPKTHRPRGIDVSGHWHSVARRMLASNLTRYQSWKRFFNTSRRRLGDRTKASLPSPRITNLTYQHVNFSRHSGRRRQHVSRANSQMPTENMEQLQSPGGRQSLRRPQAALSATLKTCCRPVSP
jgi:hypothetical protein